MPSMEIKLAIVITTSVLGSVFLACACLFFRKYKRNKRSSSNSAEEKTRTENSGRNHGIDNVACEDATEESDFYETCETGENRNSFTANDVYDYATIERPRLFKGMDVVEEETRSNGNLRDCPDSRVYQVLERPSEEVVTADPFYFTLERQSDLASKAKTNNGHEDCSGCPEERGTHEDTYAVDIPEELYGNVHSSAVEVYVDDEELRLVAEGGTVGTKDNEEYPEEYNRSEQATETAEHIDVVDTPDVYENVEKRKVRVSEENRVIHAIRGDIQIANSKDNEVYEDIFLSGRDEIHVPGEEIEVPEEMYVNSIPQEENKDAQRPSLRTLVDNKGLHEKKAVENKTITRGSRDSRGYKDDYFGALKEIERPLENTYVIDIHEIYENVHGEEVEDKGKQGTKEVDGNTERYIEYYDQQQTEDEGVYVIGVDEFPDDSEDEDNPDTGIYENWQNEVVSKTQDKIDSGRGSYDSHCDEEYETSNTYENLSDLRKSLAR